GRQLFGMAARPEAVVEVILFDGAEVGDLPIAAVVIGDQQAAAGDHFRGTASAKLHDGILQAAIIDAVEILLAQLQTEAYHLVIVLADKAWNPHAFVGADAAAEAE